MPADNDPPVLHLHLELDLDDLPDPEVVYEQVLKTCAMAGIEPTSRERALGLMQELTERLSGRPEPTQQ